MKWVKRIFWIIFSVAVLLVLFFAAGAQKSSTLLEPKIFIEYNGESVFLTQKDLLQSLTRKGYIYPGQSLEQMNLPEIEAFIRKMPEVKEVEVYSKLGDAWNIDVKVRKPIARVFNNSGESFYLDEDGFTMAPSNLYTARVLVFTGNIPDRKNSIPVSEFINNDTLKSIRILDDIYRISNYVCRDAFLSAQIGQIHRDKNGDFLLIPQVGAQKIIFGSAKSDEEVTKKFKKLVVFYEEGLPYEGWNTYDEINLKYDKQIVCRKKDNSN
jgi:cell division protein FtsQ